MFYCGFTCVLFMMSFRCVYDSLVFAFMLRLRCFMLVLYVFGLCKALSLRSGSYRRSPLGLPKTYHTARRLVKGKEKLKRVSCTQKNGLELVHPERVRPGEAQNGGLEEKKRLSKKDCVLKPVEP